MAAHLVVDYKLGVRVEVFETGEEAHAAYAALSGGDEGRAANPYAVRSGDDPAWATKPMLRDDGIRRAARVAASEAVRKEVGATALAAIRGCGHETFDRVVRIAWDSLKMRGFKVERFRVEEAVKSRVLLGRCRKDRFGYGGCDRAYWMPKSEGPLHKVKCPHDGRSLNGTSLAYGRGFLSLTAERAKVEAASVA